MATLIRTNSNSDDDILTLSGDSSTSQLLFTLTQSNAAFVNELGIFSVDDDLGTVNGISPSQPGYLQAALTRSQTIFSALPNNGTSSRTRRVSLSVGNRLGFYLVPNSTTDTVLSHLAAGQPSPPVFFSLAQANTNRFDALRISELGNNAFTLAWEDTLIASQQDFDDFVLTIQPVDALPLPGTTLQGKQQGELIDLRQFTSSISANIIISSEAAFHNFVGFYIINDAQGTVIDPLTGIAITPGQAGYAQAAVRQSLFSCDRNGTSPLSFNGGVLLAPYIIANGTPQQLLSQNPNNQSDQGILAYFPFLSANPDGIDHIRLLGDNTFSFEDWFGGGDKDFNDMVVQVNITTSNPQPPNNPSPPNNQPPTNNPSPPDNQPPANSVPLSQTTSENTPVIFSTANGNPIVISDSDAGTNSLQVTLSATDSTLTLSGTTGLSFTSGGNGTTSMTFIGTLADINAALNGLTLTPNPGFSGTASLTLTSNDQGNTGSGGALSDSDTIAINVTPIPISYGILEFTAADYSAAEGNNGTVNTIVATIQRTGNTAGVTKVELHLDIGSTATPNDYVNPLPIAVAFNEGETLKTIEIPIIGDLIPEGDDTIHLRLANPTDRAILGTQQTAVYTIINDDTPAQGQLQFSSPTFSINETGTAITTITVTRTGGSTGAVSATITPTNGTAIGGASLNPPYDYNNTPITVSWLDGETAAKTVTIPIFNDFLVEGSETVNLTLGNPTGGAILGTQSTATLIIEDVEGLSIVTSGWQSISIVPGNGDGTFAPVVTYDMLGSGFISAVTVGDWDGDGDNDLAAVNYPGGSISVRLNLGNGIFAPTVSYAVANDGPEDLTHGDLDGDGDLDLATSKLGGGVVVLLNNGDGTFVPSVTYPAGTTPEDITIGDWDGDGDLDLATSSANAFWLATVLLNNGDGTFAPGGTFGQDANQEATNADLDGDGDLDLITSDVGADFVSILINDGNANFAAPVNYAVGNWPEEVIVGDLDGDNDLDLASANIFDRNVSVLLNNGDATFAAAVNYSIPGFSTPNSISLGDFDQDGDLDLVTANGANIFVLSNNGNGTFAPAVNYPVTGSAFVTVASF